MARGAPFQKPRSERGTMSITMLRFSGPVDAMKPAYACSATPACTVFGTGKHEQTRRGESKIRIASMRATRWA